MPLWDGRLVTFETMSALGPLLELWVLPVIPFLHLFMPGPLCHFSVVSNVPFLERSLLAARTLVASLPPVTVLPLVWDTCLPAPWAP